MKRKYYIHQQSLFKIQLNSNYFLELTSASFLGLNDGDGDSLTLYGNDFKKLHAYLKDQPISDFRMLTTAEKLAHLTAANVRLIKYFSPSNLAQHELDVAATLQTNQTELLNKNGTKMPKDGKDVCVVFYGNHIYMHPKVRSEPQRVNLNTSQGIGINHSSLTKGQQVSFAGLFRYDEKIGWIINNESGHYITRSYQIKTMLIALKEQGMNLAKLTVQLYIPKKPGVIIPTTNTEAYDIIFENAADYLERVKDAQSLPMGRSAITSSSP